MNICRRWRQTALLRYQGKNSVIRTDTDQINQPRIARDSQQLKNATHRQKSTGLHSHQQQHRKWCSLLDWPARRGVVLAFLCWLFIPGLLLLACEIAVASLPSGLQSHLRFLVPVLAFLLWGGMTVWYAAAFFLKPVRLSNLSTEDVTVTIKNKIAFQRIQGVNSNRDPKKMK